MSDLIAISFDSKEKAQQALERAGQMQKQHLLDLADAVIVTRDDSGKVRLQQSLNLTAAGAASGGMWGTLVGLLFLNPLIGLAVGAASGALAGSLQDYGINDKFMKDMGNELQPGTSALFVLVRQSTPDRVLPELRELGGKVFTTSLSRDDEQKLREALQGEVKRRVDAGEPLVDADMQREHEMVRDAEPAGTQDSA